VSAVKAGFTEPGLSHPGLLQPELSQSWPSQSGLSGRTVVIACAGSELDLARTVAASFEIGIEHVVVDLGGAEMVDSSTLTALKRTAARLRSRGGTLSVIAPHPGLASLFRLTLLSRSFNVFGSLDAALKTTS
jgi:anti-anti-sigma factor